MYKILIITIFVTLLNAQNSVSEHNPKAYSALGDVIYDNVNKIESLNTIEFYNIYKDDIEKYVKAVQTAKIAGTDLDLGKNSSNKKEYLNSLRALSKKNDFFLRSVRSSYNSSIKTEDSVLFSAIINSGLIDTDEHKQEIIDYYFAHIEDINSSGVIQIFLDQDSKLKALKEAQSRRYKSRKTREEEKIKRIRENDRIAQEKLEKKLQKDLEKQKLEIRENQEKELSN